jgi:hypothetical protein
MGQEWRKRTYRDNSFLVTLLSLALIPFDDQVGLMHSLPTRQAIRRDIVVIFLGAHSLPLCCSLLR